MALSSPRKAAITGMGIVSCLGKELDAVADALEQGQSGIVFDQQRKDLGFKSPLTAKLPEINPKEEGLTRKNLRTMCEPALYAAVAARKAVKDSGLEPADLQTPGCGIIFGNDSTIKADVESIDIAREHGETHYIGSGYIFRSMNSTITMNLAGLFGTQGANWTVSAACASGAHVLGQAMMLIRSGLQDIVIAGGAQEIHWTSMASFDALNVFSCRFDQPQKACRPFDRDRDGLVPGGGGACLILESLDHALARNARIYGTIEGYGFSSGIGKTLSNPDSKGSMTAMKQALKDAGLAPDEITYINAHATSTPAGDLAEAIAIHDLFGPQTPVSSTKSMTGHECWMSGASEVIYTTLMARKGFLAPNINFTGLDETCPPINVISQARPCRIKNALSNSFGFGGTNASLILNFEGPF
ncbi:beta-ketoacyl-[acyl-carrier-protein] synthase family protein [uncultured Desulfobacter sp.]|uniref:beta-ketoacyl-[acyl-carrier-protein] synthase family protein n=1 Tax=uncultured Desulfobacter sp. TaxID=240139 RepID=UPI002AAB13A8|nr:beta-ketoacyl-[acyl-carrier-protein] synthase family protein [uncultured Desulfobacter sp.]